MSDHPLATGVTTLHDRVRAARERLVDAGLAEQHATIDAEVLARLALGWDRAEYLARRSDAPPSGFQSAYESLVARRARREPVAQIAGYREFWNRDFEVSRDVLTPRPETELIVEEALAIHASARARAAAEVRTPAAPSAARPWRLVDVGTGSGCLAVTLALELSGVDVLATEISPRALAVARRNAIRLGAGAQVRFVSTSLLEGVAPGIDLIVSNPPYVPDRYRSDVSSRSRLRACRSGVRRPGRIRPDTRAAPAIRGTTHAGGLLLMEFGAGQNDEIHALVGSIRSWRSTRSGMTSREFRGWPRSCPTR